MSTFAPSATGGAVRGLAVSPDGGKLAVGGQFTTLDGAGSPGFGLGIVSTTDGSLLPTSIDNTIRNAGTSAAIWSLTATSDGFYGTAYNYGGTGNFEGVFRASWSGDEVWAADCHGDSYDTAPVGDVVYFASHTHYCGNLGDGGLAETTPRTFTRAGAFTSYATGVNHTDIYNYASHTGEPSPSELEFFPDLTAGTYTGMNQAAWDVTASPDGQYVVMGGEFTKAGGTGQQGLVRYATRSISPHELGPVVSGAAMALTARSQAAGTVELSWNPNWDRDDDALTYALYRGNAGTPFWSSTRTERPWEAPITLSHLDTGQAIGSTASYRVKVCDPSGNCAWSSTATATVAGSPAADVYSHAVLADGAVTYWRLDQVGSAAADFAATDTASLGAGVTRAPSGALLNSTDASVTINGSTSATISSTRAQWAPTTFSEELWFKSSNPNGGRLAGFGTASSGMSGGHDRLIYFDSSGAVHFGVWDGDARQIDTVVSQPGLSDNRWHQVVGTEGPAGLALYIDGRLAASDPSATVAQHMYGYWRLGYDMCWGPESWSFNGSLDEFAVYSTALTPQQVNAHWIASGRASALAAG